ncbi:MAG: thiamine pyrophosphate-dependent dehydrogenase E1 component subunit alpha [Nitrospinota bacterium]
MEPDEKTCLRILETMLMNRHFELRVADLFAAGKLPGFVHLSIGGEAVAAGTGACLREDDYIITTHRGHGHCIAKGADIRRMMGELFGKRTGYCKAKGGSMHLADIGVGILGANGIVGAGFPIAIGSGVSSQYRGGDQVTVCFFGDGASNHTTFHECINLASVWDLPVLFVCENNNWAISLKQSEHQRVKNVADRASAYGIPGATIDGNDVIAVYETVGEAVKRAREGKGPSLIECRIHRWRGHFEGDPQIYRTKEEIDAGMEEDPLKKFKELLIKRKVITEEKYKEMEKGVLSRIDEAVKFAEESPLPAAEEALEDVYVSYP